MLILILTGFGSAQPSTPSTVHHSTSVGGQASPGPGIAQPTYSTTTNVSLTVNATSVNLSSEFWGTTVNNEVRMFRGETDAVNATPARVLVWPGAMAGEDYDPLRNIHYNTYNGTPTPGLTNESQFVQMCKATNCTAIVQVPAEIDDPAFAEQIVNYTEVNLSFHPAYWMIGNEPELWEHWKVPWKGWPDTYTTGPTPGQFANEVLAYVKVIRAVDNTTPILGLPASGCTCGSWTFDQWIYDVLKVTGPKIQAVAFHEYPAGWLGTGNGSLQAFYGTIQSAAAIPPRMVSARQAVTSACSNCNVSVFISELGSALSWSAYGQYAIGFSGSLSLASQITQAMDYNLTNVDLFATELATTNSWFNPTGGVRADYALYTGIFDHLGTEAFPVNVSGLSHTLYGIDTIDPQDHGRRDLLVVNDNIGNAIRFTPQFAEDSGSAPVEGWSWNGSIHNTHSNGTIWVEPYTPNPVPQEFPGGLPTSYVLPPQSMVLFESYPSGGTYVRVLQHGVPPPTRWYASVGPKFYATNASNISLLLPSGAYPVSSVPIPMPLDGKELVPTERLQPFVASPVEVSGRYTNFTIDYAPQWRVDVLASPDTAGTVSRSVGWWNASEPLQLSVSPYLGYAFTRWDGWGPGSYSGPNRTITIVPGGRIIEKAELVVGEGVDLRESGLPVGTPWSVSVRGFTTGSTNSTVTVFEPNGTFGFSVGPVPGYRILPQNGSFTVTGSWTWVKVEFVRITPPPPSFPVIFRVSGLPASTPVPITVRGVTQSAMGLTPQFRLLNGSYAYQVGYVPGYHAAVPLKTFFVHGGPLIVDVPFVQTVYHATWEAIGVRLGMNWSVSIDGVPISARSAWVNTALPNGSYFYSVQLPADFSATPRNGTLVIAGFGAVLPLLFNLAQYPTGFVARGLGPSMAWSVRLGNQTQGVATGHSSFLAANGTYTFDVHAPAGYYAVPSHGTLTVAGPTPMAEIHFHLSSNRPSAALVAALSSGALSVSIWIGGSIVVGFAALRWMRRRGE